MLDRWSIHWEHGMCVKPHTHTHTTSRCSFYLPLLLSFSLPQLIKALSGNLSIFLSPPPPPTFFVFSIRVNQWSGIIVRYEVFVMVAPLTSPTHFLFATIHLPFVGFLFSFPSWLRGWVPKVVHLLVCLKTGSLPAASSIERGESLRKRKNEKTKVHTCRRIWNVTSFLFLSI